MPQWYARARVERRPIIFFRLASIELPANNRVLVQRQCLWQAFVHVATVQMAQPSVQRLLVVMDRRCARLDVKLKCKIVFLLCPVLARGNALKLHG